MNMLVPAEMLEAKELEYRVELGKAHMLLVRYREVMEEHGIEPPDVEGEELLRMWRDCAAVITTASDFIARLGTSKELLADKFRPIGAPMTHDQRSASHG